MQEDLSGETFTFKGHFLNNPFYGSSSTVKLFLYTYLQKAIKHAVINKVIILSADYVETSYLFLL